MARKKKVKRATIFLRKDGRWSQDAKAPKEPNGKRKRKTIYGKTPEEVEEKVEAWKKGVAAGLSPGKLTVGAMLEAFHQLKVKEKKAPNTLLRYRGIIKTRFRKEFLRCKVSKLNKDIIQDWVDELEEYLKPNSVKSSVVVFKGALAPHIGKELMFNPMLGVIVEKPSKKRPVAFTSSQARVFLQACRSKDADLQEILENCFGDLFETMIYTGLRIGEALGLPWSDVYEDRIEVTQQLQIIGKELRLVEPKSDDSKAAIYLMDKAKAALARRKAEQAADRLVAGPGWRKSGLVFTNRAGHPLVRTTVRKRLQRLCKLLELPVLSPHGLRHTTATVLLESGAHPKVVQTVMRHANFAITMDFYSHVSPELQETHMQKLDSHLS